MRTKIVRNQIKKVCFCFYRRFHPFQIKALNEELRFFKAPYSLFRFENWIEDDRKAIGYF